MSLRSKLLLFLFPSLLLLFGGLYFAVSVVVEREELQSVISFAEQHLKVISNLQKERFEHLATKSKHVASLPIFKAALAERSPEQIRTVTENLLHLPESTLLLISDENGSPLYRRVDTNYLNIVQKKLPSIDCALTGQTCRSVIRINSDVLHLISMPVSSGPDTWGVLTTGFIYSNKFLEELQDATEYCEITVASNDGHIAASTIASSYFDALEAQLRDHDLIKMQTFEEDISPHILKIEGNESLSISKAISDEQGNTVGHMIVHQSLQGMEAILSNVQQNFIIMGSIILLLLLIADSLLTIGLIRPIEQLVEATRRIAVGEEQLGIEPSASNKEVDQLTAAINGMLRELNSKTGELRNSETQYRNMVDSAHDAIISADADMHIVVWNRRAETLFGYSEKEMLGQHVNRIIPKHDQRYHLRVKTDVPDGALLGTMVRRLTGMHRDGSEIPVEISLSKSTDSQGQPLFTTIIRDLSSEMEAEAQTRMLTNAIEQSSDMIVITDTDANILYVNPAFERVTGYAHDEVLGQKTKILKSGKQPKAFYEKMWETILASQVWKGRMINRRKSGELYPEEMTISPVTDKSGTIQHFVAIKRDISEQERLKTQIEHTQRLESLGVLAGGIAHDFNNILTAIMGNAVMAESKLEATSPATDHVERIVTASNRAADLCRQMLAYSGKGQFVVKPINLSELVSQMSKLLEVSIGKNIELNYDLNAELPAVKADISQVQQVIMNLITNASEAIGDKEKGRISITTRAIRTDPSLLKQTYLGTELMPGDYVYLEVSDNGCGMDEKTSDKIFDPFFTTKFSGRGLGMSAVLGIVRGHNGSMKLSSEPGKGTTFRILFPSIETAAEAIDEKKPTKDAWQGSGTILIVDDEESIREVASVMLSDMGFATLTACDGVEGVDIYERHRDEIVAVLLDMTMPRMNGEETFLQIRKIDPEATVLLSSGYTEQDATTRFSVQGLAGFIQKPYTPEILASKLQETLKG